MTAPKNRPLSLPKAVLMVPAFVRAHSLPAFGNMRDGAILAQTSPPHPRAGWGPVADRGGAAGDAVSGLLEKIADELEAGKTS